MQKWYVWCCRFSGRKLEEKKHHHRTLVEIIESAVDSGLVWLLCAHSKDANESIILRLMRSGKWKKDYPPNLCSSEPKSKRRSIKHTWTFRSHKNCDSKTQSKPKKNSKEQNKGTEGKTTREYKKKRWTLEFNIFIAFDFFYGVCILLHLMSLQMPEALLQQSLENHFYFFVTNELLATAE